MQNNSISTLPSKRVRIQPPLPVLHTQRYMPRHAACQFNLTQVQVEERLQQHNLVARREDGLEGYVQSFRRPYSYRHLGGRSTMQGGRGCAKSPSRNRTKTLALHLRQYLGAKKVPIYSLVLTKRSPLAKQLLASSYIYPKRSPPPPHTSVRGLTSLPKCALYRSAKSSTSRG